MKVLSMNDIGFDTEEDFFPYDEVRKTYFLTRKGYERRREENEQRKAD